MLARSNSAYGFNLSLQSLQSQGILVLALLFLLLNYKHFLVFSKTKGKENFNARKSNQMRIKFGAIPQ